jgi:hypothetical protein
MRCANRHASSLAGALLVLAGCLAGCVVVPYRPAAKVRADMSAIASPERLRLSVGPRRFLDSMARGVLRANDRLRQVDGRTLLDTASAQQELTLARLLEPRTRALIEPLDVDYLVLFGEPVSRDEKTHGGMVLYLGFFGAMRKQVTSSYWTTVIDARQLRILGQATSESRGTVAGIGAFYGLFIAGNSDASARDGAIRQVAASLAAAHPAGQARVAFLAVEPIPTAEELAALARREERERVLGSTRWSTHFPAFAAMAAPAAGQALIYVYRPDTHRVPPPWILDFSTGPQDAEGRLTSVQAAGYHGFYAPAGELQITVRGGMTSRPMQSVTLTAEAGQTYFVRAAVTGHLIGANELKLSIVDAERGWSDLRRCRRMPSSREYDLETRHRAEYGSLFAQLEFSALLRTGTRYADGGAVAADKVEAYKWLEIARQHPDVYTRRSIVRDRQALAATMDAAQVAEAERRAHIWIEAPENQVP